MGRISIIRRIRVKKLTNFLAIFLIMVFVLSLTTNFLGVPKQVKAGITVSGNTITIDGGGSDGHSRDYLINSAGEIRTPLNKFLYEEDGNTPLDYRYYSYLMEPSGVFVNPNTNLIISNYARVMMEGTQKLANLTVQNNSIITQPYLDRSGDINNKPLYTNNYWAMMLTGFLKIPRESAGAMRYYDLYFGDFDEGCGIEIGSTDTIGEPGFYWIDYYSQRDGGEVGNEWPAVDNMALYRTRTTSTTNDRYLPIRVKSADKLNNSSFEIYFKKYNAQSGVPVGNEGRVSRGDIFGISWSGSTGTKGSQYHMDFEYYVSIKNEMPQKDLGNTIKTSWAKNINILEGSDSFSGPGNASDYFDSTEAGYGSNKMYFKWTAGSPLGVSLGNSNNLPYREASRYSAFLHNSNLVEPGILNRIAGGLTLDVAGMIDIETSSSIDLRGTGYPGYAGEMSYDMGVASYSDLGGLITPQSAGDETTKNMVQRVRGGSIDLADYLDGLYHGKPGGGYSNIGPSPLNGYVGGGGSHAGGGGYRVLSDRNNVATRAETYGDENYPITMGSGAGAGGNSSSSGTPNIAGSGGGLLIIRTSNLTIGDASINVDGSAGKYVSYHAQSGGAGGAINIITDVLNLGASGLSKHFTAEGSNGDANKSIDLRVGGGGGYIRISYNSANKDSNSILERASVAGGVGSVVSDPNVNGGAGKLLVSLNTPAKTSKILSAYKRNGVSDTSFNPYELQLGDEITVTIKVSTLDLNMLAKVTDDTLRIPGTNYQCVPQAGSFSLAPLLFSQTQVIWQFTPIVDSQTLLYRCKVENI